MTQHEIMMAMIAVATAVTGMAITKSFPQCCMSLQFSSGDGNGDGDGEGDDEQL